MGKLSRSVHRKFSSAKRSGGNDRQCHHVFMPEQREPMEERYDCGNDGQILHRPIPVIYPIRSDHKSHDPTKPPTRLNRAAHNPCQLAYNVCPFAPTGWRVWVVAHQGNEITPPSCPAVGGCATVHCNDSGALVHGLRRRRLSDREGLRGGGEWQWLVRHAGCDVAEGAARASNAAKQQAEPMARRFLPGPCLGMGNQFGFGVARCIALNLRTSGRVRLSSSAIAYRWHSSLH
jgi:hypothetical protein